MPVWLITFLTQLITPIVEGLLKKLEVEMRINAIEKEQSKLGAALNQLNRAETPEEMRNATDDLAKSINNV